MKSFFALLFVSLMVSCQPSYAGVFDSIVTSGWSEKHVAYNQSSGVSCYQVEETKEK